MFPLLGWSRHPHDHPRYYIKVIVCGTNLLLQVGFNASEKFKSK